MNLAGCTVAIVTPVARGSRRGNRVTALRLAALLRRLGLRPFVCTAWPRPAADGGARAAELLIAIHAGRSAAAIAAFRRERPRAAIVVVLAGTELYPRFDDSPATLQALAAADRIVGLQAMAALALPAPLRGKVRTIVQSATPLPNASLPNAPRARAAVCTHVCVVAHVRAIKQPTMAADALALLPDLPQLRVDLIGSELEDRSGVLVRRAIAREPRFRWLGELPRRATLQHIAASDLVLVTSLGEGGAAVIGEAIVHGTPVLATAVPGNIGLLGADWPGLFAPDRPEELARLLRRGATEPPFVADLRARTADRAAMFAPARERQAWAELLAELASSDAAH